MRHRLERLRAKVEDKARRMFRDVKYAGTDPLALARAPLLGGSVRLLTHRDDMVLGAMLRGELELCPYYHAELHWLAEHVGPDDVVLDAGANLGSVSIALALRHPSASIFAFEPDALNFGLLQANIAMNRCGNVRAFNLALGNNSELLDFYCSPDNFGDHRTAKPKGLDLREQEFAQLPFKVRKVRCSELMQERYPGTQFDVAKIDTQGADFEILSDIFEVLAPKAKVAIEFSPYHLDSNGTNCDQVVEMLQRFDQILRIRPVTGGYRLTESSVDTERAYFERHRERYAEHVDLVLLR